jgi:hypothetical protein
VLTIGGFAVAVRRSVASSACTAGSSGGLLGWLGWPNCPNPALVMIGSKLAVLLLLGLSVVIGLTYRNTTFRRSIGVVWDISTFWPRGAHPFAPPCYAERAVPELVTRVSALPATPLVLGGHSQGGLLTLATIAQLSRDRRERLFLLTFGCQVTRLYGRAFPAFFGRQARQRFAVLLGGDPDQGWAGLRWRNLYRDTDYLGWPISGTARAGDLAGRVVVRGSAATRDPLGEAVDRGVLDPRGLDPSTGVGLQPDLAGEVIDPPIRAHSDYPLTPEYVHERELARRTLLALPS